MAKAKKGKFLAVHTSKLDGNTGKPLRSTFPIKNKAYYLENGWKEVDKYDGDESEADAPEVAPPAKELKLKAEPKAKAESKAKAENKAEPKAEPKAPGAEEVSDAV